MYVRKRKMPVRNNVFVLFHIRETSYESILTDIIHSNKMLFVFFPSWTTQGREQVGVLAYGCSPALNV